MNVDRGSASKVGPKLRPCANLTPAAAWSCLRSAYKRAISRRRRHIVLDILCRLLPASRNRRLACGIGRPTVRVAGMQAVKFPTR